jgi:AraC-like DNA-binding protein
MAIEFNADDCFPYKLLRRIRELDTSCRSLIDFHSAGGDVRWRGRLRSIGSIRLYDVRLPPCEALTTPVADGRCGQGWGKVDLVVEGKLVIGPEGRQTVVEPGDLTFTGCTRPSRVVVTGELRVIGVLVPLETIAAPRQVLASLTATTIDGTTGSGVLLASFLTNLAAGLDDVRPQEETGLSAAAGDLIAAALAHGAETSTETGAGADAVRRALLRRIRFFVETEISDPALGPASIASAHHISVRQLHRLFEGEGTTISEMVRHRRLAGCRRELVDPDLAHLSIGAIAARWGILDSAKFSRLFRAAHGLSPREYRAERGAHRQEHLH